MDKFDSNYGLGLFLGLIGVIIFGATLPATRIAVGVFDPWFVILGRALLAGEEIIAETMVRVLNGNMGL